MNADPTVTSSEPIALLGRYREAVRLTDALIDPTHLRTGTLSDIRRRATERLERLTEFLASIGNPERTYPVVHVAGTSGKGSTATMIYSVLTEAGYRCGVHTSPYLQVATEKLQIGHQLIAADDFAGLVESTLALFRASGLTPTYGELWVAMALRWFAEQHVDLAVVEVGAGGRFDLTNVVSPAVSVITSIGLDHTETLGPTIEEITWNKAGIIKAGAPVVTAVRDREAMEPILREAKRVGVQVIQIEDSVGPPSLPHPPGGFQLTNAKVAMAAIEQLAPIGFSATPDRIFRGLSEARIPGRLERVQTEPVVVLDGAHNPQKIASLVESLGEVIGEERPIVLLGILASKDAGEIVSLISSVASELILTRPRVLAKTGFEPRVLAELASKAGFCGAVEAAGDPRDALDLALSRSREESGRPVLVTGSLYLVGNLRGRWYPDDQIVLQRTPWPVT